MVVSGPLGPEFLAPHLDPRDENDPFCTCPSCGLLGSHEVEVVVTGSDTRRMRHPELSGRPIDVAPSAVPHHERSGWVLDAGSAREARRTCVFCQHVWHTPANGAEQ